MLCRSHGIKPDCGMQDDSQSCVVYSNDGSGQSGVGNYVVQSITVNGTQRNLPTFSIFTETRSNLKDLTISTMDILSASTGHKYSASDILKKIDFTMTDSSSHNLGVDLTISTMDILSASTGHKYSASDILKKIDFTMTDSSSHNLGVDLTISTMDILSASTGHKYSASDILKKIDFTMTDSSSHNLGVMEMACNQLQVESVPPALLCNVHPLMMFQNKQKQLCQQIHDALGKRKTKYCFLVDVEFQSELFVVKAIKCLSNFINKDSSSKPWNSSDHFSDFIKLKENMSISLKDHKDHKDSMTAALPYLPYLEKFNNIRSYSTSWGSCHPPISQTTHGSFNRLFATA